MTDTVKRLGIGQATQHLKAVPDAQDDPRGWPLDPSEATLRLTRRERVLGALTQHSKRRRSIRAFPLPSYVQEWFTAPLIAKVIMALPVLAILALIGYLLVHGGAALLWEFEKAAMAGLVMAVVAGGWAWYASRY